MMKEVAKEIPLSVWQDPQGDVVIHHSRQDCSIYFGCWEASGIPADYICELKFDHAWAVRGYCLEHVPYKIKDPQSHSCILEVENSLWLQEISEQRRKLYPRWKTWDKRTYHHYVVLGHDNYYEIIAAGFVEHTLSQDESGTLSRLITEA